MDTTQYSPVTPLHIMLIISSLGGGGAERVMVDLAEFLVAQGIRVTLVTLEGEREDRYKLSSSVSRIRLNIMWPSNNKLTSIVSSLQRLRMIRREVTLQSPNIVISFIDLTNIRVLLSLIFTKIPIIISERIDPRHHRVGKSWDILRRLSYQLADRLIVQTTSAAEWAKDWYPSQKVHIIPNAVRPSFVSRSQRPLNMPPGNIILGVGRLSPQKGFDLLISAFANTDLALQGWSLVILGEGEERSSLELLIKQLNLNKNIKLPGAQTDPESWLQNGDIFVLSSRYEGFPNVLLEAMQCGLASIAFDCNSGPADIIRHETDGLLIPNGDILALSNALKLLANDQKKRERLGKEAKLVAERFSSDRIYTQWQRVCANVIAERKNESAR
ncbi:glycosyltransferase family 4 protein [Chitinivorax sp. B]|uniref:glycosyltransferase family 4 protein n=1 Tax=Chitinivorax sp. B TaxID=2502235 RepID=UPI0010F8679A|nr:glycosyltransferase family 4 protein [Chitinivorax sp. B]